MKRFAVVGAAIVAALLAAGWGTAGAAAILGVLVTNTSANPVPVQQQGVATVAINPSGNHVLVDDERVPIHLALSSGPGEHDRYTVPVGKRLVVESANFAIRLTGEIGT